MVDNLLPAGALTSNMTWPGDRIGVRLLVEEETGPGCVGLGDVVGKRPGCVGLSHEVGILVEMSCMMPLCVVYM